MKRIGMRLGAGYLNGCSRPIWNIGVRSSADRGAARGTRRGGACHRIHDCLPERGAVLRHTGVSRRPPESHRCQWRSGRSAHQGESLRASSGRGFTGGCRNRPPAKAAQVVSLPGTLKVSSLLLACRDAVWRLRFAILAPAQRRAGVYLGVLAVGRQLLNGRYPPSMIQHHRTTRSRTFRGKLVRRFARHGSILFGGWSFRQTRGGSDRKGCGTAA